jgi:signal transduction histidine kinase
VLVNLVVNAIQAVSAGGQVLIETKAEGDDVVLAVSDDGAGMDEEMLKKVFVPFFTTKEPGKGTGLGLSVVHGIVSSHGGTVHVESAVGKGSRFEVRFPLHPTEEVA